MGIIQNQKHVHWPSVLTHTRNVVPAVGVSLAIKKKNKAGREVQIYTFNKMYICNIHNKI